MVFDSADAAGWDITSQMNPVSQSDNNEYHWLYVRNPTTGKIGYTDPYNEGESGGEHVSLPLTINGQPAGNAISFGMGHTHGRRSVLYPTSDQFSTGAGGDLDFMRTGGNGQGFNFFTLGTPTNGFWEWTPYNDPHLQRLTNTD